MPVPTESETHTYRYPHLVTPGRRRPGPLGVLLLLCGLFIVYGTTLPFDFSATSEQVSAKWHAALKDPRSLVSIPDLVSNVLLFLPWGALVAARLARRGRGLPSSLAWAIASGCVLSLGVEALQLYSPTRVTSPLDVLMNSAGSALGALGGWITARVLWPVLLPILRRELACRPLATLALATGAALLLLSLSPYDISLDVDDLKAAVKQARPVPFGPPIRGPEPEPEPWPWAEEFLTWGLVGGLFALALRESGREGPAVVVGAAGLAGLLGMACELGQLAIRSRVADATSITLAVAGAAAGAAWVSSGRRRSARDWIGPAWLVWALIIALDRLAPPTFAIPDGSRLGWSHLVPFYAYYQRTDIYAISDLLNETAAFLPAGMLLAARGPRGTIRRAALVGLGFGLVLEAGQLFNPSRTADVTDALSAAIGAGLGFALWRWGEGVWRRARQP